MKSVIKRIAILTLTASCFVFTLPSSAKPSDEMKVATTQAAPKAKAPNCKDPTKLKDWDQKSYCFAVEGATKACRSIYGVDERRKCRNWYLVERFQPWTFDGKPR